MPGNGLEFTMSASVAGIKFEPSVIKFDDFTDTEKEFLIKIRSDVLPGFYTIFFNKDETALNPFFFYLDLLPI